MQVNVRVAGKLRIEASKEVKNKILYLMVNTLSSLPYNTYISMLSDFEGLATYEEFIEKAKDDLDQEEFYFNGDAKNGYQSSINLMKFWIDREIIYLKGDSKEGGRNENKEIYELALNLEKIYNEITGEPAKILFDFVETDDEISKMRIEKIELNWPASKRTTIEEKCIDPFLEDLFRFELFSPEEITWRKPKYMREIIKTTYGGIENTNLSASFLKQLPKEEVDEIDFYLFKNIEDIDVSSSSTVHKRLNGRLIYTYEIVDAINEILSRKEISYIPDYLNIKSGLFKDESTDLEDNAIFEIVGTGKDKLTIILAKDDIKLEIEYLAVENLLKPDSIKSVLEYKGETYLIKDSDEFKGGDYKSKQQELKSFLASICRTIFIYVRTMENRNYLKGEKEFIKKINQQYIVMERLLRAYTK